MATDFASLDGRPTPDALVAMGGAVTNLAAVKHGLAVYDPAVIQGTVLDRDEIDRQIELYRIARRRGPTSDRRSPAEAGRSDPGRRVHRPDGDGQARPDVTDGQRLRAAPRRARRAVRRLGNHRGARHASGTTMKNITGDRHDDAGPLRTTCLGQGHGGPAVGRSGYLALSTGQAMREWAAGPSDEQRPCARPWPPAATAPTNWRSGSCANSSRACRMIRPA